MRMLLRVSAGLAAVLALAVVQDFLARLPTPDG